MASLEQQLKSEDDFSVVFLDVGKKYGLIHAYFKIKKDGSLENKYFYLINGTVGIMNPKLSNFKFIDLLVMNRSYLKYNPTTYGKLREYEGRFLQYLLPHFYFYCSETQVIKNVKSHIKIDCPTPKETAMLFAKAYYQSKHRDYGGDKEFTQDEADTTCLYDFFVKNHKITFSRINKDILINGAKANKWKDI